MEKSILVAGFGGQGVMLTGQLLGYAATRAGLNASFYPAYGPEQRGGTASCTVVVSEDEISTPVVNSFDIQIILNEPSRVKFLPRLKPGGLLILNQSMALSRIEREDVRVIPVKAIDIARGLGSDKVANIVLLGALMRGTNLFPMSCLEATLREKLAKKPDLLETNMLAFQAGLESGEPD